MDDHPDIHLPSPSFWPIVLAFGLALISAGVIWSVFISLAGIVLLLVSIAGWALENRADEMEEGHE